MTYFAKYDLATGAFRGAGFCAEDQVAFQAGPGQGVVISDGDVLTTTEDATGATVIAFSMDPVRSYLIGRIDREAEDARLTFITAGAGQALTYQHKAAEAGAYAADPGAPTPFLSAQSALTGVSVADIAAEVMAAMSAWVRIGSQIEAARSHAKDGVASAANLLDMVVAASVDWSSLTAEG